MNNNANNSEYVRLKELGNSKYEVATNEPDIRGWTVKNDQGRILGKVSDLLFDIESNKVLYILLDLEGNELHLRDRKVLVPMDIADVQETYQNVVFSGVTANELTELPTYEKGKVNTRVEDVVQHAFASTYSRRNENKISELNQQLSDKSQTTEQKYYQGGSVNSQQFSDKSRPQTVIGVFEHTNQGQSAIEYLLDNNFRRDQIEISSLASGYIEGENHDNSITNWFKSMFENDDDAKTYTEAAKTGCVITVQASSMEEAEIAAQILDNHGALSINDSFSNQNSNFKSRILDRKDANIRGKRG